MNLFDLVVVVILIVAMVVGFRSGALPQMVGLVGALVGGGLILVLLPALEETLALMEPSVRAFVVLVGILFSVGVGEAIGSAIGRTLAARLGEGAFGKLDRVLGAFVGAAQALLIIWLTGGLLAAGPSPMLATQAQKSFVLRALTGVLPAPTEIAGELARLLNDTALPDLFVGLEPIPAAPVDLPDDPLVQELARDAIPSVVKVTASTCDAISLGTGFVVDRGYVVTNAHVVAGARTIRVAVEDQVFDVIPVFFDSKLDVALLYSSQLQGAGSPTVTNRPRARSDRRDIRISRRRRPRRPARRGRRGVRSNRAGHLRQDEGHEVDPGDPGGDRSGRQRRTTRPDRRHDRRRRLRRGANRRGGRLRPDPVVGRRCNRAGPR